MSDDSLERELYILQATLVSRGLTERYLRLCEEEARRRVATELPLDVTVEPARQVLTAP